MLEPDELRLAAILAMKTSRPAAEEAVLAPKAPEDSAGLLKVLYADLAFRRVKGWPSRERPALERRASPAPALNALYLVHDALLAPEGSTYANALAALLTKQPEQVQGDDMVVLTAPACRRAGGDAWRAFRENSRELLGRLARLGGQPLSGCVVTLANNLSKAALPCSIMLRGQEVKAQAL